MTPVVCLVVGSSVVAGAMLFDRAKRKAWLRDVLGIPDQ